jgi:hypothetical protein
MKMCETHVQSPEFLESFRRRLNQSWSIDRNVGTGVHPVFHAVDEGRDRFDLSRNSNLLPTVNNAMWGRG